MGSRITNRQQPGFAFPKDDSNFKHPWLSPQNVTKTKVYDLLHKGTITTLIALSAYGAFELARGVFYIQTAKVPSSSASEQPSAASSQK